MNERRNLQTYWYFSFFPPYIFFLSLVLNHTFKLEFLLQIHKLQEVIYSVTRHTQMVVCTCALSTAVDKYRIRLGAFTWLQNETWRTPIILCRHIYIYIYAKSRKDAQETTTSYRCARTLECWLMLGWRELLRTGDNGTEPWLREYCEAQALQSLHVRVWNSCRLHEFLQLV